MVKKINLATGIFVFLFVLSPSLSLEPQKVVEAFVSVNQSLSVEISGSGTLEIYIPQNNSFQKVLEFVSNYPFKMKKDSLGNDILVFELDDGKYDIWVYSVVESKMKTWENGSLSFSKISPVKRNILTSILKENLSERNMNTVFSVLKWVCKNIEYDELYSNVVLDPEEILKVKKGTCDEFSTLTISFLQSLGIPAKYEAGYSFDGEKFLPHAWIKVGIKNRIYYIDPTWCEMPVDALHIEFASLDENHYQESKVKVKGISPHAYLTDQNVFVKLLNYTEKPIVLENIKPLDDTIPESGFVVASYDLFSDYCVISKTNFGSCMDEERTLLEPLYYPQAVFFCNKKKYYVVFNTTGANYRCPIYSELYSGNSSKTYVKVLGPRKKKPYIFVDKKKVKPGDIIKVSSNGFVFTISGQTGYKIKGEKENFYIFSYKDGMINKVLIEISNVSIPEEGFEEIVKNIENNTKEYTENDSTEIPTPIPNYKEEKNWFEKLWEKIENFFKALLSF